jgi:exopolysaccharide biosynthesis protein
MIISPYGSKESRRLRDGAEVSFGVPDSMGMNFRPRSSSFLGTTFLAFLLACVLTFPTDARAAIAVTTPYSGMTRYSATNESVNGRNVNYQVVVVDTLDPQISFYLTPSNGALLYETTRQTTKNFATAYATELAINAHLFNISLSPQTDITGMAASNGDVYSPAQPNGGGAALNISATNFPETVTCVTGGTTFQDTTTVPYTTIETSTMLYKNGVLQNQGGTNLTQRTSVGISRNGGKVIFFASSSGMTEKEGADILVNVYGAFNVHPMDGGGSTTMVLRTGATTQTIIAIGSSERAVGTNLGVQAGDFVDGIPDTMSWDADTSTSGIQQGGGTWDFATTNWSASGVNRTWANSKTPVFGAGAGAAITLGGRIAATDMTVDGGYTFGTSGGPSLTLLGNVTTTGTAPTTINAPLGPSTSVTKRGAQTLVLGTSAPISMLSVAEGTVDLSGQTLTITDPLAPMTIAGGTLQNGTIAGSVSMSTGKLLSAAGVFTITKNLTLTGGTTEVSIGTSPGTIVVNGTATLGGTIKVNLTGPAPSSQQDIVLLTANAISGNFSAVDLPAAPVAWTYNVVVSGNQVVLRVSPNMTGAVSVPVINGSFETLGAGSNGYYVLPVPTSGGWVATGNVEIYDNSIIQAYGSVPDGTKALLMARNDVSSSISQSLNTTVNPGDRILVSFSLGNWFSNGQITAEIYAGTTLVASSGPLNVPATNSTWVSRTLYGIVASTGNLSIKFSSSTSLPWLDNVTVSRVVAPIPVPVVGAGQSATGTSGVAFTYQIAASNSPTSYALSGGALPAGVTLTAGTGLLSGTPSAAGTFTPSFTATNAGGTSPAQAVTLTIYTPYQAWLISQGLSSSTPATDASDGDGWTLLQKYALGGTPGVSNPPPSTPAVSGSALQIQFTLNMTATDVVIEVQGSSDLVSWTTILSKAYGAAWSGPAAFTQGSPVNNLAPVTVTDTVTSSPRFLRIRVTK